MCVCAGPSPNTDPVIISLVTRELKITKRGHTHKRKESKESNDISHERGLNKCNQVMILVYKRIVWILWYKIVGEDEGLKKEMIKYSHTK